MIHDEVASVCSLARNVRDGIDLSKEKTEVASATLKLLLDTLIDLAAPPGARRVSDDAHRTVAGQMQSLQKVQEAAQKVFDTEARFNGRSQ